MHDAAEERADPAGIAGVAATRLLLVTSLYPTADRPEAGAFVWRRVQALRRRGVQVEVVASRTYRVSALARHVRLLLQVLRPRPRPDGVEGHVLFVAGLVALVAARLHRRPLLIYAHGADVRVTAQRSPVHRALAQLVARGASIVVTNSASTARHVERLGAVAEVVSPGVDFEQFSPDDRAAARARLALAGDKLIALYVGGLSLRKGADVFAAALADLPQWQGVMVGGGELDPELRRQAAVRLVGVAAPGEIPAWMQAADVVVVPSREEPLGLAAVEALACGIPVVASRTGGLIDVVQDDVNGLLVDPADPNAIAAALVRLEDASLRSRLAGAARASVAGHDIRVTTEEMAALWRRLGVRT